MSNSKRQSYEHRLSFASGVVTSQVVNLGPGGWGTIIVPSGSALIGKQLQFVAVSESVPPLFDDTEMLSTPITLVAGANSLSADQIREAGTVTKCRLKINSAVGSDVDCILMWKA